MHLLLLLSMLGVATSQMTGAQSDSAELVEETPVSSTDEVVTQVTVHVQMTSSVAGGTLYVYDTAGELLGVEDMKVQAMAAGCAAQKRPHMVRPNRASGTHTHVAVPYPASGGIHILDATTRNIVACFNTKDLGGVGTKPGKLHDVVWSPDDSYFVGVDMGGWLHKFSTYLGSPATFAYVSSIDLTGFKAALGTDAGPKPISVEITPDGLIYVTMAHGGALVLNGNQPDIVHLHTYSKVDLSNAVGGLWATTLDDDDKTVLLEFGTQTEGVDDKLFFFNSTAAAAGIFGAPAAVTIPGTDAHGMTVCKDTNTARFVMITNRISAELIIVDVGNAKTPKIVNTYNLERLSGMPAVATDYAEYDAASGKLVVATRGPEPLSALKTTNAGFRSGTMFLSVASNCRSVAFEKFVPALPGLTTEKNGVSDIHGVSFINLVRGKQVWALDQAASYLDDLSTFTSENILSVPTSVTGGTLYVYDNAGTVQGIDDMHVQSVAAGCVAQKRPHMVRPNRASGTHTHVAVPYPASGGIHILDATTRNIVACFDTTAYGPGKLHDIVWAPDDSYLLGVDMGGHLHKFSATNLDSVAPDFTYVSSTDLTGYKTALGTDAGPKPISVAIVSHSTDRDLIYVTMAHGGALVLEHSTSTGAITHLHTYSMNDLGGSVGGLWATILDDTAQTVVLQYGTQEVNGVDKIHFFDSSAAASGLFTHTVATDAVIIPGTDAHGLAVCKDTMNASFMMITNRVSADLVIVRVSDKTVVARVDLVAGSGQTAMAPDYAEYASVGGVGKLYVATRGPSPLSALKTENPDFQPGTLFLNVMADCLSVTFDKFKPTIGGLTVEEGGVSDVHGVGVVSLASGKQIWALDQAASSIVDLAAFTTRIDQIEAVNATNNATCPKTANGVCNGAGECLSDNTCLCADFWLDGIACHEKIVDGNPALFWTLMYIVVLLNLYVALVALQWKVRRFMALKSQGKAYDIFTMKCQRFHSVAFVGLSAWNHVFYLSIDAGGSRDLLGSFGNNLFAVLCDWYLLVGYLSLGVTIHVTLQACVKLERGAAFSRAMSRTTKVRFVVAFVLLCLTLLQASVQEVQTWFPIIDGIVYCCVGGYYAWLIYTFESGLFPSSGKTTKKDSHLKNTINQLFTFCRYACGLSFVNVAIVLTNKYLLHTVPLGPVVKMFMFFLLNLNHFALVYVILYATIISRKNTQQGKSKSLGSRSSSAVRPSTSNSSSAASSSSEEL